MKRVLALLLSSAFVMAQTPYSTSFEPAITRSELPVNKGSVALWQTLRKLHTRASLIMVTAHPDDEDGGMLTYHSRGKGTRVALLTLNRGEGGANVISPDYFDALGLVRTQELLTSGRYYGVDQYWTRVVDYGFSKTLDESLTQWTRDRVLYDVVRVVRIVRPLVITSVFVGGPSDGHGNHQAAGAMAQAVFAAAGDPNVFPDQIKAGLRPWNPVKGYARVPFFRRAGAQTPAANVTIPEGAYDPMLGASYVQISREGLGAQITQNGGPTPAKSGKLDAPYLRFASTIQTADQEQDFFDGIDVSLAGIATLAESGDAAFVKTSLAKINASVEESIRLFSASQPASVAPALAEGMKETLALLAAIDKSTLSDDSKYNLKHELNIKRVQFNNALLEALGVSIAATVSPAEKQDPRFAAFRGDSNTFRMAIPGQKFDVQVRLVNPSAVPVKIGEVELQTDSGNKWPVSAGKVQSQPELARNETFEQTFSVTVPEGASYTKPYFSRQNIDQGYYDIDDPRYLNKPLASYPLAAWAEVRYANLPLRLGQTVQTVQRDNGHGVVYEPLTVGPAIGISISPARGIVPLTATSFNLTATIHSNIKGPAKGSVKLDLPVGWTSEPAAASFATEQDGDDRALTFKVVPQKLSTQSYKITAVASCNGKEFREGYSTTGYPGVRPYFLYRASTLLTSGVDAKVPPNLKVGYIMGSGDEVPASLENLNIKPQLLTAADLAAGDLSHFDAIVLGVRTYAARPDLIRYNNRLLDYVKNGGVAIVQYNTPEFDHNFGPFPYVMGADPEEVTDQKSKVTILEPANALFQWPNKITEADFEGWVEERGSKWMKSWDPQYTALLETHDKDQAPQKGGLLYARYGKGVYIYNAYAFYRELPEGVPGAFRLFANMLSLKSNPQLR